MSLKAKCLNTHKIKLKNREVRTLKKRGQVTIFVIAGIILVVLLLLVILARDKIYVPATQENLRSQMDTIKRHVSDCLLKVADEAVNRMALQGGYLNVPEGSYLLWNDSKVSYLCYNQIGLPTCTNRMLTRQHMEKELQKYISNELRKCVNVYDVGSGGLIKSYDITVGKKFSTEVVVQDSDVLVELTYPITLTSKDRKQKISEKTFTAVVEKPLGELYGVAMDIVNAEARYGVFDVLTYMMSKKGRYTIYPLKPYPDKLYRIKMREGDFIFQMAIEGEPLY